MSWDIYGNLLKAGHCEVHPDIAQPFPCSICQQNMQPQFSEPTNLDADLRDMTMRDKFAMAAVASLASEYDYNEDAYLEKLAERSYRIADAMLKERGK